MSTAVSQASEALLDGLRQRIADLESRQHSPRRRRLLVDSVTLPSGVTERTYSDPQTGRWVRTDWTDMGVA